MRTMTIQVPAFGSFLANPAKVPTATINVPIPSAMVKSRANP